MLVRLTVSYIGTHFAGWQFQPGQRTVQGELEEALFKLTGRKARVTGSGRTDAGVHALAQVCHADIGDFPPGKLRGGLNFYLPDEIRVIGAESAPAGFHARFSAVEKTYKYIIYNGTEVDALLLGRVCHVREPLDISAMRAAAALLEGKHDFAAFMSRGGETRNTVRTVYDISVTKRTLITFTVTADGFLYNMVRKMAGFVIDVGRGRIDSGEASRIAASGDPAAVGLAPASGLYLVRVGYARKRKRKRQNSK